MATLIRQPNIRQEAFNLDSVQLKRLEVLIVRSQARKKKLALESARIGMKKKDELMVQKIQEMLLHSQREYVATRLRLSNIYDATLYAKLGDEHSLRQEIEMGHDINERDMTTGRTPLLEAIAGGHFHIVRMLCSEYLADVHIRTLLGHSTPLHLAVCEGYRQIASLLITHGADVNATDKRGCTPLHYVQKISLAKLLFKQNLNPCIQSTEGLLPSEHYKKYCPVELYEKELELFISEREELRDRQNRKQGRAIKDIPIETTGYLAVVNASTILMETFHPSHNHSS